LKLNVIVIHTDSDGDTVTEMLIVILLLWCW